jgi:hypothetical protein
VLSVHSLSRPHGLRRRRPTSTNGATGRYGPAHAAGSAARGCVATCMRLLQQSGAPPSSATVVSRHPSGNSRVRALSLPPRTTPGE